MPLPAVRVLLTAPEPLLVGRSFIRLHNRCAKEALREEGTFHWKNRIPIHFTRAAHQKYGYQQRSGRYMRIKARRWRSVTDLVKTGQTKREMVGTPPVIRIGGKASDEDGNSAGLKLTLVLPFNPGNKANAHFASLRAAHGRGAARAAKRDAARRTGVTIAQMRKEIATITNDEGKVTARRFQRGYGQRLAVGLARSKKLRKQVRQITR